jgi:hypothetical protein
MREFIPHHQKIRPCIASSHRIRHARAEHTLQTPAGISAA